MDNDSIKEILKCMSKVSFHKQGIALKTEQCKTLLDYITNLQQENEIRQQDINNLTYQLANEKSRIDKTIEFLKEYDNDYGYCDGNCAAGCELLKEIKNILKGDSK